MKKFILALALSMPCIAMEVVEISIPIPNEGSPSQEVLSTIDDIVRAAVFITFDSDPRTVFVSPVIRQALESELSTGSSVSDSSETREYRQRIIKKFSKASLNDLTGTDYIELRQWVLHELKEYHDQTQQQLTQLKEQAAKDTEEAESARKKTKYAIITTVVTTVCGLLTTVTTYLLTHYLGESSN